MVIEMLLNNDIKKIYPNDLHFQKEINVSLYIIEKIKIKL
jgi:hypothetical protein